VLNWDKYFFISVQSNLSLSPHFSQMSRNSNLKKMERSSSSLGPYKNQNLHSNREMALTLGHQISTEILCRKLGNSLKVLDQWLSCETGTRPGYHCL
jgi:hypothetical protein